MISRFAILALLTGCFLAECSTYDREYHKKKIATRVRNGDTALTLYLDNNPVYPNQNWLAENVDEELGFLIIDREREWHMVYLKREEKSVVYSVHNNLYEASPSQFNAAISNNRISDLLVPSNRLTFQ